jgi:hypothetical protein
MTPITSAESPAHQDMVRAWACAINLKLYDADPGPRAVEMAGALETRTVDRREALLDVYSRDLLSGLAGDPARLEAVEAECQRRARIDSTRSSSLRFAVRRLKPLARWSSWRSCLAACTRQDRRERREAWLVAAELAVHARRSVSEAGGDTDETARARLLAATDYSLTRDTLGSLLPSEFLADQGACCAPTRTRQR